MEMAVKHTILTFISTCMWSDFKMAVFSMSTQNQMHSLDAFFICELKQNSVFSDLWDALHFQNPSGNGALAVIPCTVFLPELFIPFRDKTNASPFKGKPIMTISCMFSHLGSHFPLFCGWDPTIYWTGEDIQFRKHPAPIFCKGFKWLLTYCWCQFTLSDAPLHWDFFKFRSEEGHYLGKTLCIALEEEVQTLDL